MTTPEHKRLAENKSADPVPVWHKWGPYVSERAWGTVREDYSDNGDAWNFFPFDKAHERVYRWGEDGIAGWCDRYQTIIFAPAFWNGHDGILKERLFGLSSPEGNHAEDVKELYYHSDATPTHSYMKYLYKYPHNAFPYQLLREKNAARNLHDSEYELVDTGIFDDNRYFDIVMEYAKNSTEDLCIRIEAFNRGNEPASLHILPQLWFRNQWAWWDFKLPEPSIKRIHSDKNKIPCVYADDTHLLSPTNLSFDYRIGGRYLYGSEGGQPLFTNNENKSGAQQFYKNGFHQYLINKEKTINAQEFGTKACIHYFFENIPAQGSAVVYLRFTPEALDNPLQDIEAIIAARKKEADDFYDTIHPPHATLEEKMIQRQALAGMVWNKQFYFFDVNQWLQGSQSHTPPPSRAEIRNAHWQHLNSMRVLSMPDKWEYPWFAAWDLAFHCISLGLIDIEFAKEQLWLLLFDQFQHPNGAIPAYEWEFSDLNPPVQAWAALRLFDMQKKQGKGEDFTFLKKCFMKLLMNFSFWVNKIDSSGCNVFEGGFLGLDNITLVDRSDTKLKDTILKQSDGTGWMAMFSLNLMKIALELSKEDGTYQLMATKFFQHFVYIANAMKQMGNKNYSMWDDDDGFFYDVLVYPNRSFSRFRVRSLVGLIPLFAVEIIDEELLNRFPEFKTNFLWFLKNRKTLTMDCVIPFQNPADENNSYILSLVTPDHLKKILHYIWDPEEFHSNYGIRSLSKYHEKNPFIYKEFQVGYEPAESINRIKGGNSNWRGPIWFPINYLILTSLQSFAHAFEPGEKANPEVTEDVKIEQIIISMANSLISIFKKDPSGKRPFFGPSFPFVQDPHFQDHLLFYEYFHGENGQGLGASHQTGWTGLVANLIDEFRK